MATPHNQAEKGMIAKTVLMPGDPLRAKYVAEHYLENAVLFNDVRNMYGYTGTYEGKEVFVHADLDDRDQTVNFPEVRTNATDMKDGDHEISYEGTVTVVDSVEYRNLTPGVKYLVSGVLMDKSAGKAANAGGEITGETEFTAKEKDGTVEVSFTFDSSKLKEGSYVVFETLYKINAETGKST